jgi:hypothetical protein
MAKEEKENNRFSHTLWGNLQNGDNSYCGIKIKLSDFAMLEIIEYILLFLLEYLLMIFYLYNLLINIVKIFLEICI